MHSIPLRKKQRQEQNEKQSEKQMKKQLPESETHRAPGRGIEVRKIRSDRKSWI